MALITVGMGGGSSLPVCADPAPDNPFSSRSLLKQEAAPLCSHCISEQLLNYTINCEESIGDEDIVDDASGLRAAEFLCLNVEYLLNYTIN